MPDDGLRIRDHVIAQMVTHEPEKPEMSDVEQAFRAGYQAALHQDYPGRIGAESEAWRDWSAHKD